MRCMLWTRSIDATARNDLEPPPHADDIRPDGMTETEHALDRAPSTQVEEPSLENSGEQQPAQKTWWQKLRQYFTGAVSYVMPMWCEDGDTTACDGNVSPFFMFFTQESKKEDMLMWDTGAQIHAMCTQKGAVSYFRACLRRLMGVGQGKLAPEHEADYSMLVQTMPTSKHEHPRAHTLTFDAPFTEQLPLNIVSAGKFHGKGYSSLFHLDGWFKSRQTGKVVELHPETASIITPDGEFIRLEQIDTKPNLYFLKKMEADTNESTQHLKRDYPTIAVLRESEQVRFDVEPDKYCTEVQEACATIEGLHRNMATKCAHEHEFDEAMIAWVSQGREIADMLQHGQPSRDREHVESLLARIDISELTEVCARCEDRHCSTGTADTCLNACSSCGSRQQGKHKVMSDGTMCYKHGIAERKIYALKATHTSETGAAADTSDDKLEELHKAAHANCDRHPCEACKLHAAATGKKAGETDVNEQNAGVHNMQASSAAVTGLDLSQIKAVYASLKAQTPTSTWTTHGRSVHATHDAEVTKHRLLAHMYNDAGVCKSCHKHWRECACAPDAETTHVHAMQDQACMACEHTGMRVPQQPHTRTHAQDVETEGASAQGINSYIQENSNK